MAYSFIGYQTLYIATNWNPIYWNTACLIINSGSLEDNSEATVVDIHAPEAEDLADGTTFQDLPDGKTKIRKTASTDYAKMAKAIGDIISRGSNVSLIDINKSNYSFEPDAEDNQILFGMKGLNKVGDPIIEQIIAGRPYTGIIDFMNRCPLNKTAMVSLIKAGAFDRIDGHWAKEVYDEPRKAIMAYYILQVCDLKKRLTLQNFNGLMKKGLIPQSLDFQRRTFVFNKYLKDNQKVGKYYVFNEPCITFYEQFFDMDLLEVINGCTCILQINWDKQYKTVMDDAREWLKANQEQVLTEFNDMLFRESWEKYASGTVSAWEMESLCFYYHEHELANVDTERYGIVDFFELPSKPLVEYFFKRNGKEIPIFETYKIMGTVIGKNDARSSISLLTTSGVVNVKFTKDYFAMFNRQISEVQSDGTKKVMEKGWFTRGVKLMVTGFRRDDMFQAKSYKHTSTHQLYRINSINANGDIELQHERYQLGEN